MDTISTCAFIFENECVLGWLAFGATVIGGFFALYKWRKDASISQALRFRELLTSIRSDSDMCDIIYKLDDDTFQWFNEKFVDSKEAVPVDKLLFHFCYLIYLSKNKIVKEELVPLIYEIDRVLLNPQLQDYLYNLQQYSARRGIFCPFDSLIRYGLKKKLLDTQFEVERQKQVSRKNLKFHKYYEDWLHEEAEYVKKNY